MAFKDLEIHEIDAAIRKVIFRGLPYPRAPRSRASLLRGE